VITGLSGSGKSTALRALEDIGFFCVDNLPVVLLPKFLEIQTVTGEENRRVALVMDMRERSFLEKYRKVFERLKDKGYRIEILFLDAGDDALLHRFSETRRFHPMAVKGSVMDGINTERTKLASLKQMADKVIDTTSLNVHQLKDVIQRYFLAGAGGKRMIVNITSFGYRYGLTADADMVLDVRFLPNPYFVDELRKFDGHHESVARYVESSEECRLFMEKLIPLMTFLIPLYEREGKATLNIALGCTGGKHRSVVVANVLGSFFSEGDYHVNIAHRDITKS
jgi:UPF0042 nucleotide-binding protein